MKHQPWYISRQGASAPLSNDIVKNRYLQAKSMFVPRAKFVVSYDEFNRRYEMAFTEDIINKEQPQQKDK